MDRKLNFCRGRVTDHARTQMSLDTLEYSPILGLSKITFLFVARNLIKHGVRERERDPVSLSFVRSSYTIFVFTFKT